MRFSANRKSREKAAIQLASELSPPRWRIGRAKKALHQVVRERTIACYRQMGSEPEDLEATLEENRDIIETRFRCVPDAWRIARGYWPNGGKMISFDVLEVEHSHLMGETQMRSYSEMWWFVDSYPEYNLWFRVFTIDRHNRLAQLPDGVLFGHDLYEFDGKADPNWMQDPFTWVTP